MTITINEQIFYNPEFWAGFVIGTYVIGVLISANIWNVKAEYRGGYWSEPEPFFLTIGWPIVLAWVCVVLIFSMFMLPSRWYMNYKDKKRNSVQYR